ncbi:MAG: hypothetical protein KDI43_02850 [Gammaproteobacteria bacterium]|nr:hypothetical protein [Gammaproteobacteria bacterium]MCP5406504.1 hypothetical protein [Chromatiaceae bacterium]
MKKSIEAAGDQHLTTYPGESGEKSVIGRAKREPKPAMKVRAGFGATSGL